MALYSQIEDRYLAALTAVQFPEAPVADTQQPVTDATSVDGMQLAAGPSQTVTDAGAGRGSYAGFDPRQDAANKAPMGEIKPYDPTVREQLAEFLQAGFERFGMDRFRARKHAQSLIGGPNSNLPLDMGLADIVPFLGTALQTQEAVRMGEDAVTSAKQGNYGTAALQAGGAALGLVPGAAGTAKAAMAVGRAGERLAEKTVPQIMEKGGTMADLLQALSHGSRSQLTAYHGTPHTVDKFDSKKIGTGEGNQTYGYGLYFAENPDVAKSYMAVSPSVMPPPIRTFKGTELEPGSPEYHAASLLDGMSLAQARKTVAGWLENPDPRMTREAEGWRKTLETLNAATSKADFKQKANKGNLYTVDIPDEMVSKMLDFEAPFNKQPKSVQEAIKASGILKDYKANLSDFSSPMMTRNKNMRGENIMQFLEFKLGGQEQVAARLQELGIPGVRYLDAGSRDAGKGSRNIVVFPGGEDQVKILKQEGKK